VAEKLDQLNSSVPEASKTNSPPIAIARPGWIAVIILRFIIWRPTGLALLMLADGGYSRLSARAGGQFVFDTATASRCDFAQSHSIPRRCFGLNSGGMKRRS
jgi:hypothetical protein